MTAQLKIARENDALLFGVSLNQAKIVLSFGFNFTSDKEDKAPHLPVSRHTLHQACVLEPQGLMGPSVCRDQKSGSDQLNPLCVASECLQSWGWAADRIKPDYTSPVG